jgi:hypothetical protein
MAHTVRGKKRSKLKGAPFTPVFIVLFVVGWIVYWIGQFLHLKTKQPLKPIGKMFAKQNEVELMVVSQQEKEIRAK